MCTFKNLEEIWKTWKKIEKQSVNRDNKYEVVYFVKFTLIINAVDTR